MNRTEQNTNLQTIRPGRKKIEATGPAKRPWKQPKRYRLLTGETKGKMIDDYEHTDYGVPLGLAS